MIVDRKQSSVVVGDISSNGAMVRAPGLPRVGTEIVLAGKAFEIVATVAWRTDETCGLSFHREVDPLEIVRQNVKGLERFRKNARPFDWHLLAVPLALSATCRRLFRHHGPRF